MSWIDSFKSTFEQDLSVAENMELGTRHAVSSSWHAVEFGRHAGLSAWYFCKAFHTRSAPTLKVVALVGTAAAVSYFGFDFLR